MRTALLALALVGTCLPTLGAQNVPDLAGHWTLLGTVERGRFTPSTEVAGFFSKDIDIVQESVNMTLTRRWSNGMTTVRPFRVGTTTTFSDGHRWKVGVKNGALVIQQLSQEKHSQDLYAGRNVALDRPDTLFTPADGKLGRVIVSPEVPWTYRVSPDGTTLDVTDGSMTGRYGRTASTRQ